jgi:acyl dehydratase
MWDESMPLTSSIVGAELDPRIVEVTTRMAMAYAAGIGDLGPCTFDDTADGGTIAPPSFCVALEWPVLSQSRVRTLALDADELLRVVHVEQDSIFHRAIRPGDRLRTSARIVSGRSTRAGAFIRTRALTADVADGTPVTSSWHGAIYRNVAWTGPDVELEAAPACPSGGNGPEQRSTIETHRESAHVYTECSGIWNPIHTERRAARAAGLPGIILHGTAIWAMAGREVIRLYGHDEPVRLRRLRARFSAMVSPGETLTLCSRQSPCGTNVHFVLTNAEGRVAVADGFAELSGGKTSAAGAE